MIFRPTMWDWMWAMPLCLRLSVAKSDSISPRSPCPRGELLATDCHWPLTTASVTSVTLRCRFRVTSLPS